MRQAMLMVGLVLLGSLVGGCVVVDKHSRTFARPTCHPSQYWDGSQCRHKGKGHGARKHDGRGKGRSADRR
jgi:hypothetical protein